jgi:TolA-binding protein
VLERRIIRRLLATAPLCALTACATTAGTAAEAELTELKAQVRAMRESQARLEKRLERLELHESVSRARASSEAPSSPEPLSPPELTVVKLKPRKDSAPALPTAVPIVEPAPEDMEMFISASDGDGSRSGGASEREEAPQAEQQEVLSVLELEFEQAVAALRTGNVEGGVARLLRFAEENPRHSRADNALYFGGLGQIGLKDPASAARTFEILISRYPAGDAVLDGMLRLAECRLRLNQTDDARALYTRILTQFPGTAAATQAEQRLASLSH